VEVYGSHDTVRRVDAYSLEQLVEAWARYAELDVERRDTP
jgi:hypothetical protein